MGKKSFNCEHRLFRLIYPLFAIFLATGTSPAETSPALLYRAEVAQQTVLRETETFVANIESIIRELEINGLSADQVDKAREVAGKLSQVARDDLQKLATRLESLRTNTPANADKELLEILKAQTAVAMDLRKLSRKLAADQQFANLGNRLSLLIERQTRVYQVCLRFASRNNRKGLSKAETRSQQVVLLDQATLQSDLSALQDLLQAMREDLDARDPRRQRVERLSSVLNTKKPAERASAALNSFKEEDYSGAIPHLDSVLETLSSLLAQLNSDPATLRQMVIDAAKKLQDIADTQRELEKQAADAKKEQVRSLAERQQELSQQAAALQRQMEATAPVASRQISEAVTSMEQSTQSLQANKPNLQAATNAQREASERLDQAAENLRQLAASAPDSADERHAALAALDRQMSQAQTQLQQSASTQSPSASSHEANLAQQLEAIQQNAAPVSSTAAQSLSEAASAARSQELASAAEALSQARAQVQQEMRALAPEAAAQSQLQQAAQQVAAALEHVAKGESILSNAADPNAGAFAAQEFQRAAQASAQASAQNAEPSKRAVQAASQLSQAAQQSLRNQTSQAAHTASQARESLQQALNNIQNQLAAAQNTSQQPRPSQNNNPTSKGSSRTPNFDLETQGSVTGFIPDRGGSEEFQAGPEVRLSPTEREAMAVLQNETAPPAYQSQINDYFRNLAEAL